MSPKRHLRGTRGAECFDICIRNCPTPPLNESVPSYHLALNPRATDSVSRLFAPLSKGRA